MSDAAISKIIQYGTQSERLAFTPTPPTVGGNVVQTLYLWHEEDNPGDLYAWDGSDWVQVGGGGGGGGAALSDTVANIPAAGTAGRIFLPTNGVQIYLDTGAAWAPWGPMFPFTAPVDGDFAWINQGGTATVSTANGGIYLAEPAQNSNSLRIRKKSAPSTPYTFDIAFTRRSLADGSAGLIFRESSSGKIDYYQFRGSALQVTYFSSATSGVSHYMNQGFTDTGPVVWLRASDNGTDRIFYQSCDGQHWQEVTRHARTTNFTADEIGFAVDGIGPKGTDMMLYHWKQQ